MSHFDTRAYCVEHSLISFSCGLKYDSDTKKKIPMIKGSWKKINAENYIEHHDYNKSGFGIMMGLNNLIVLDCDIDKSNGLFPNEILAVLNNTCKSVVKTPNGKHYYFRCTKPITRQNNALWNGTKIEYLDLIANDAFIFAPPTNYTRGDEIVAYQWLTGDLSTIIDLPDEIYHAIKPPPKKTEAIIKRVASSESLRKLLFGLNAERFNPYNSWIQIGAILHNDGIENGCELWDEASKRVPEKYQEGVCAIKWQTFKQVENPCTVATLYAWLKEDNLLLFNQLKSNSHGLESLLINPSHRSLAEAFYALKPDQFIYAPNANFGWFALQSNNVWCYQGKAIDKFKKIFYDTLAPLIEDLIIKYQTALDEDGKNEQIKKSMDNARASLACINGAPFLINVNSWLQDLYCVRDIHLKMDLNPNLFAFNDKVYDFIKCDYRPIDANDYISITCGYNAPTLETANKGAPALNKFLDSLFENEDTKQYLINTLAYSLCGTNYLQEFYLWKGRGGNGKGLLMSLLLRSLGRYIDTLPISYLVKGSPAKGASLPELAACKAARVIYSTEPDSNNKERLQNSVIKNLTGGDPQNVRGLFKDPFTYTPQFTLFIQCNDCKFNKVDAALQRRMVVVEFPFEFKSVDLYNKDVENHRIADRNIDAELQSDDVRSAFMMLLLETYKLNLYGNKEISRPTAVKESIKEFFNDCNPLANWLYTKYNISNDSTHRLTPTEFVNLYNADNQETPLTSKQFGDYMSLLGYNSKNCHSVRYYVGFEEKPIIE